MRGDRANYGKQSDCKRVTIRLYGDTRRWVEGYAREHNVSIGDAIHMLLEIAARHPDAYNQRL